MGSSTGLRLEVLESLNFSNILTDCDFIILQAIDWMRKLKEFNIYWIEEPTCADDVLGHKAISEVNITSSSKSFLKLLKKSISGLT